MGGIGGCQENRVHKVCARPVRHRPPEATVSTEPYVQPENVHKDLRGMNFRHPKP